jgi:hypothetical protein
MTEIDVCTIEHTNTDKKKMRKTTTCTRAIQLRR